MRNRLLVGLLLLFCLAHGPGWSQTTTPDMLENAITSVVTVGVYQTDVLNKVYGFRGGLNIPEKAYEKALDLTGTEWTGSGFLYEYKGRKYAITNAHVIENASTEDSSVFVFMYDRSKHMVKVLGADSFYDIAVLEFAQAPGTAYPAMAFKQEPARLGEPVYAIGNPLGEFPYSVSEGIISGKNRVRGSFKGKFGFLQSTATIIWGNSGGPLVDQKGKVAGINSQIEITSNGYIQPQINFALEAGLSERLVRELIDNRGRVVRTYLGVGLAQQYDGYSAMTYPVYLSQVVENSPAANELIKYIGSPLTHINGEAIASVEQALGILEAIKPGRPVEFTLQVFGEVRKVSVTGRQLDDAALSSLASHVLRQSQFFSFDQDAPQAIVRYNHRTTLAMQDNLMVIKPTGNTESATYQVVAAGISSPDNNTDFYKVVTMAELGSAIRLSSMSGALDLAVVRTDDEFQNVVNFRFFFSGDENIVMSTLFY
ncbi:MAG: trypsin-like peptidase domain-containing protein [Cyclobacteriaceae bacterium]|nr:trypsin-like peptidase domain-containing protein [Cyclobacteriaceae bacterium]